MKIVLTCCCFCFGVVSLLSGKEFILRSPDSTIVVTVDIGDRLLYSVRARGMTVLAPSEIAMTLEGRPPLGVHPSLRSHSMRIVQDTLNPVVRQKCSSIVDHCTEATFLFQGDFRVIFRVYNDGVAYRFSTTLPDSVTVLNERADFAFETNCRTYFPEEDSFMSHSERTYQTVTLHEITPERFCSLPMLVRPDSIHSILITEADLNAYPGMYLTGSTASAHTVSALFPAYPERDTILSDRDVSVTLRKNFIARTAGTRTYPWRVLLIPASDGGLIESTMIYTLASPADPSADFSWVRPGKVAWDWWNATNVYGVNFRAGINTQTYRYYIDFASKYGIPYIILDEGWYVTGDLLTQSPGIDVEQLVSYGVERNVGIILWCSWKTLNDQFSRAFDQFTRWGVKGIKVDFMQRDDQWMIEYYHRVAREAARRHLLVDFHGACKPTGWYRTYPNILTSEGVKGLEHDKWSDGADPSMAVTLPFIRMAAGPMDYTPGAMHNATKSSFRPIFTDPMSQGTRCQQLAMYVVFESPLQMLSDSPTHYEQEPECMDFLSRVPVEWDETHVLAARVGEYVAVARRNGTRWYIGAMTNWTSRDITVALPFLSNGIHTVTMWEDGVNADRNANDFHRTSRAVQRDSPFIIHLAPGGGWAAIIE